MKHLFQLLVCLTAAPGLFAADWVKMNSAHFELFTTSPEVVAKQTLENFEKARDFFLRVRPMPVTSQLPVTIVAFDSSREYRPYSLRSNTPA